MTGPAAAHPIVYIVDDDPSVRAALADLLGSVGLETQTFPSAEAFAAASRRDAPSCLVLDIRMPGLSGLDFQRELPGRHEVLSIIFITAHGDIEMSVRAMKAGAIEFLVKPFRDQDLLDAIQHGLSLDRARRAEAAVRRDLEQRHNSLDAREKQIMAAVVDGVPNKQIATALGLSEITIKVRRGHIMRKMHAQTLADLVKLAEKLRSLSVY